MKKKYFHVIVSLTVMATVVFLIFMFFYPEKEEEVKIIEPLGNVNLSQDVIDHYSTIETYCKKYEIERYIYYILAIMEVETRGTDHDVMKSSESLGLPPNSLTTNESIEQGCKYFSELIDLTRKRGCDIKSAIQAYNFGASFIEFVAIQGKQYTYELAESFAKEMAEGIKVDYLHPIAIEVNGGWRYEYGNQFYVLSVLQYLTGVPD